jgi:hypothetical protein
LLVRSSPKSHFPFSIINLSLIPSTAYPDQHMTTLTPPRSNGTIPLRQRECHIIPTRLSSITEHCNAFSIYRAVFIAVGTLEPSRKQDYANAPPPVDILFSIWSDTFTIISLGRLSQ